jgi:hypothetical protein
MKYLGRTIFRMIGRGEGGVVLKEFRDRLWSKETSLVLRCDLREHHPAPRSKIPIRLRPMEPGDFSLIAAERPRRLPVLLDNIPGGHVAVTEAGELAFMIWLIFSREWPRFKRHFKGEIAEPLKADECMLEFACTFEKFRGLGVMGAAMVMIAEEAVKLQPSARWAYNYIRLSNEASLKGCRNAGFRPYLLREEHWRAMRLRQKFIRLKPGSPFPFEGTHDRAAYGY